MVEVHAVAKRRVAALASVKAIHCA
jgi:hypothetical protein